MKSQESPKKWFAIDVKAEAVAVEAIEYAFNSLAALGTEIMDFAMPAAEPLKITGYFNDLPEGETLGREVEEALAIYGLAAGFVSAITTREVEETDWLAEWKRHWKPTEVGRFVIAPPWSDVAAGQKIVIRIEPNMAFGTGTHETTKLCLEAISRHYEPAQTFLDVGTGTGILAIAAAKMSNAKDIAAYDTDKDSISIAWENAVLNGVGGRIEFYHDAIGEDTPVFDFVCANLTLDVITPLLPLLWAKTRKKLVLSGVLLEQKEFMTADMARCGILNYTFKMDGEWISVLISRA